MSNEDQNFGLPTHTCVHCSHCFLATWDTDEDGDRLYIDLLSIRGAILAKEEGCQFYERLLYRPWQDVNGTRVRLVIEKRTKITYWGSVDPFLVVAQVHFHGLDEKYDKYRTFFSRDFSNMSYKTSIFPAASMCRRCVMKAVLRYFRICRRSSLVEGSCATTNSHSPLRAGEGSNADMASSL
jgi:hypothetical protein